MPESKKEFLRTVKFILFSVSAGAIQIASYALIFEFLKQAEWVAYIISLTLSVLWNFTLNRKYTFKSAANVPIAMLKVAVFYLIFAPLSTLLTALLTEQKYDIMWNAYIVEFLMMLLNFVTEYIYQRFFVFGKSLDTAK